MTDLTKIIGIHEDKWVIISELWDFYNKKGIKTVFMSVGASSTAYSELEISETLGCPIHIYDTRTETIQNWSEIKEILKNRKRPDSASPFTEEANVKWVLPKNIHLHNEIPGFTTDPVSFESCVAAMKLAEERIDILKVSLPDGMEKKVVYALLNSPYRPSLIMVQWSVAPDTDLSTTLCAGHLQTSGYILLEKINNRFLYLFNNKCMYEICSWETNKLDNPMVSELTNINKN
jgi:hypothetical protein